MTPTTTAARVAPEAPGTIHVECIDTHAGLTALGPQWDALLRASAADGVFLTWEWLGPWWTHLQGAAALTMIAVRKDDTLIAIAPLMVSAGAVPGFSRCEFLGTGHAGSDYLDLIVRIGHETEALDAIAGFLTTQGITLRFSHLPEVSLGAQLAERLVSAGWGTLVAPDGICPVIPLAGHTWDSYLATLGSAHRANVRRRLRTVAQQFRMRFDPVTSEAGRRDALDAVARFHAQRFATDGGSTAFSTPALRAFHDDATRRALDGGWLRMYVLWLDDVPVAVMYGFLYNRRFYFYQHGFDDGYRRHSVGLVLMALTVRAAIDEGAQAFDLLWGPEPYKRLWALETQTLRQIQLFPPHAAGRIHQRAVVARRQLRRLARRGLALVPGGTRAPVA